MARWTFGDFVLNLDTRELARAGTPVSLSPKAFQLLGYPGRKPAQGAFQDRAAGPPLARHLRGGEKPHESGERNPRGARRRSGASPFHPHACIASATPSATRRRLGVARRREHPWAAQPRAFTTLVVTTFPRRSRTSSDAIGKSRSSLPTRGIHAPADAHRRRRVRQDSPGAGSGREACSIVFPTASGSSIWRPCPMPSLVTQAVASVLRRSRGTEPPDRRRAL